MDGMTNKQRREWVKLGNGTITVVPGPKSANAVYRLNDATSMVGCSFCRFDNTGLSLEIRGVIFGLCDHIFKFTKMVIFEEQPDDRADPSHVSRAQLQLASLMLASERGAQVITVNQHEAAAAAKLLAQHDLIAPDDFSAKAMTAEKLELLRVEMTKLGKPFGETIMQFNRERHEGAGPFALLYCAAMRGAANGGVGGIEFEQITAERQRRERYEANALNGFVERLFSIEQTFADRRSEYFDMREDIMREIAGRDGETGVIFGRVATLVKHRMHRTGNDATKGMRGSPAMFHEMDIALLVEETEGGLSMSVQKMRGV